MLSVGAALLATVIACQRHTPPPQPVELPLTEDAAIATGAEAGPQISLPDHPDLADRWLFVERVEEGAPGGWATGTFDREKNKIDIRTRDVRQFAIDVERVPIDWKRLVVIGIDGKNSELRHREVTLLHFRLDDHGSWVVTEP